MKALSVKQPLANMIADGHKTIETRRWATSYRGPLLIAASKTPGSATGVLVRLSEQHDRIVDIHYLPLGKAVAVCTLSDCWPMLAKDEYKARCEVYRGAVAWVLADVRRIKPFPVRGMPGLFDVDAKMEFV